MVRLIRVIRVAYFRSMLSKLHIRNYAIIDELTIEFQPGFNIITGETGAGKSILMGALGLVLGDRADSAVLFTTTEKCVVEASFQPTDKAAMLALLQANDLDEDNQLVVRREISTAGKSRSFINDTPVTLQVLRQFAGILVDLHRQFDTLELGEDDFQRKVIDALAGTATLLQQYQQHYNAFAQAQSTLQQLVAQQQQASKEFDYHRFLFTELEEAAFSPNEIEDAEAEMQVLSNAESIKQVLAAAAFTMQNGDTPVTVQVKSVVQQLQQLKTRPEGLDVLQERLQSTLVELKDIAAELESMEENVQMDAERLAHLSDRINTGNMLLKKHNVLTTNELLQIQQELDASLQAVTNLSDQIEQWQKAQDAALQLVRKTGNELTALRSKALAPFETKVKALLQQVGMPNAMLKVKLEPLSAPAPHGLDKIQFLFDANKSGRFEPLEKVASGGELSRLMLSIKSLVAGGLNMPTLIFDEIDSGISGEAARQVGIIMQSLAQKHQLIAITHQPQIAARAGTHYFVYKQEKNNAIKTGVRVLNTDERVQAIAHMLSGNEHAEASAKIAREMLGVL